MNTYESTIVKNAHTLIPKNMTELMAGVDSWDSLKVIETIEMLISKGILIIKEQHSNRFKDQFFIKRAERI